MKTLAQYVVAIIVCSTVLVTVVPPLVNAANTHLNRIGFLVIGICIIGIVVCVIAVLAKSMKYLD